MNIAYIANNNSAHTQKWINYFAVSNRVVIICDENTPQEQLAVDNPNIKIYPILPNAYPLTKLRVRSRTLRKLKQIISINKINIIHSMYAVPYSFWAYHLGLKNHIVTTRGSDILIDYNIAYKTPVGMGNKVIGFFMRRTLARALNEAKYITSTSINQQKVIKTFIKDTTKLYLIRTGVNVEQFLSDYSKCFRKDGVVTILSNRAISPLYNIHIIVEAFAIAMQKKVKEKMRLLILSYNSDKEYYKEVLNKINALGISEHVDVITGQNFDDILQAYKNSDIVVMVPASDGTPVSGIEAMLARKPLIIGNLEYDEDIYNKNTVWKLPEISAIALADEICKILESPEGDILMRTDKAFECAVRLADTEKEMRKVEALYHNIINVK